MYRTVVTICTAQWSLYVPHSGHYMYRTVVTICTTQWSLYVSHSGHYMYRTVVTICTTQWSLYVPHSGHYMYRTVVTICATSFNIKNCMFCPHSVFMCFVWICKQTAIISPYKQPLYLRTNSHYICKQTAIISPYKQPLYLQTAPADRLSGAFVKFRKATKQLRLSVCPNVLRSVRVEQLGSHLTDFHEV